MGWGGFNLVDGIVNHLILQVHHVRDDLGGPMSWDLGYIALAIVLLVFGWMLHGRGVERLVRRRETAGVQQPSESEDG
jgi:uncharacterized membrane protein